MTSFVLFLTSRYFNKGAHYSLIALLVLALKTPKKLTHTHPYSWMRDAVSDKNVKKARRQLHINARL